MGQFRPFACFHRGPNRFNGSPCQVRRQQMGNVYLNHPEFKWLLAWGVKLLANRHAPHHLPLLLWHGSERQLAMGSRRWVHYAYGHYSAVRWSHFPQVGHQRLPGNQIRVPRWEVVYQCLGIRDLGAEVFSYADLWHEPRTGEPGLVGALFDWTVVEGLRVWIVGGGVSMVSKVGPRWVRGWLSAS